VAATAEQCAISNQYTVVKKADQWPAAAVALAILTNVVIFLHVATVFAVCTVTVVNQEYVV
jgi:hypothetical protein